jgi:HEPN domain-containing protein
VPPLTADIAFHAQQLAEKALKGFLTWHDQPFRKTHNLVEIGQQCVAIDATLEDLARRAARLTEYAWKFRYPGEPAEPALEEALAMARKVYEAVLCRLPAEVRP